MRARYNGVMASAYRHRRAALADRRREHRARLQRLDREVDAAPSSRRLTRTLTSRLSDLRERAEPGDGSVDALVSAERAAEEYERSVDEALGLDAELRKSVDPLLPRKEVVVRWLGFGALSLAMIYATVYQMGLDDFMLRALGVKMQRAESELSIEPIRCALEATTPDEPSDEIRHIERITAVMHDRRAGR